MGKNIVVGVTGGIAAYKAASIVSGLVQRGHSVKVICTASALQFVGATTFQAISRNPVYTDVFQEHDPSKVGHIDLADWADIIIVSPCSANTVGKLAAGLADDMLSTVLLATNAPVYLALAMNVHMFNNKAVQHNLVTLERYGYHFIQPEEGFLACGYVAKGRMAEPETIITHVLNDFQNKQALSNKELLVLNQQHCKMKNEDEITYFTREISSENEQLLWEILEQKGADVTHLSSELPLAEVEAVMGNIAKETYVFCSNKMYNVLHKCMANNPHIVPTIVSNQQNEATAHLRRYSVDEEQFWHLHTSAGKRTSNNLADILEL
ncbi:MAG: bifunctional phosphopantothenoylcysteine decarboxylase/phosphopantothenate--cysteine ligase CoaBC [Bacilli bacterium]